LLCSFATASKDKTSFNTHTHIHTQGEIDAQEDSFKATSQFGQSLISAGHYASEEVKEKVGS